MRFRISLCILTVFEFSTACDVRRKEYHLWPSIEKQLAICYQFKDLITKESRSER